MLAATVTGFGQADVRIKNYNLKKGIALSGYDPVSYFNDRPKEGKADLNYTFKGVTYLFASTANLDTFKKHPEGFEPTYGGWCAYAMGDNGDKVKIDPKTYKIVGGKLYLFYNFHDTNTLVPWNKNEGSLKQHADVNWKKIEKK